MFLLQDTLSHTEAHISGKAQRKERSWNESVYSNVSRKFTISPVMLSILTAGG
jgi:hypothetical protein